MPLAHNKNTNLRDLCGARRQGIGNRKSAIGDLDMPGWKDLFAYLLDRAMPPREIIERLGVSPSRLRRMLNSKRLASSLEALHAVAARQMGTTVGTSAATAAKKLADLAAEAEARAAEAARKACMDIIQTAEEEHRKEEFRHYGPPRRRFTQRH